jgi:large conductance mechanosensitive channel
MGIVKEFKEFAVRGNVMDLAVGIIIGGAFGKIVTSFVNDVIMPPIGFLMGGVDFKDLKFVITDAKDAVINGETVVSEAVAEISINYGSFLNTIIDFVIVAFAVFMMIKGMNRMKRKQEAAPAAPAAPTKEETLLTEIRDILKNK